MGYTLDKTLEKIVYSITQALEVDLEITKEELDLDSENYVGFVKGDLINTRLKKYFSESDCFVHSFKRGGWEGRMIIDIKERTICSITSTKNLSIIPKVKERKIPHYMQSCLSIINEHREAPKQTSFIEVESKFADDFYMDDCNQIFQGLDINLNEFTYYVVTYDHKFNKVLDPKVHLLSYDFQAIEIKSLNEYIKPDFAALTENFTLDNDKNEKTGEEKSKNLITLKDGIKPKLRKREKENKA